MNTLKRSGNRWTVNEVLSLQREYELLEWTVQQIADKHERSVEAILYKLESEGFISSWNNARGFNSNVYQQSFDDCCDEEDDCQEDCAAEDSEYFDECVEDEDDDMSIDEQSDVDKLTERVWHLETSVTEIGSMVKQMFDSWASKKSPKRQPLRKC